MKRLIPILLFVFINSIYGQDIKKVKMCDLKFEMSKDSTEMTVSTNGEILVGRYEITGIRQNQRSVTDFINGKAEGESVTIFNGVIIRRKYFKNGLPNRIWIEYDETGKKIIRKTPYVKGKLQGIASTFLNEKAHFIYYLNDREVSKEVYSEYMAEQKKK